MSEEKFVKLTDDFIERVSTSTDIVSVISGYIPLRRRGNRYWGCCPFHQEKTASFSVKPAEGFFYCFGCHVGGNVFKFLSMIENINYYDAVRMQAAHLNIPLPVAELSPQEIARENHLRDLRKLHDMASNFFHNCLTKTPYGAEGLAYLHQRGITDEIIQEFKLGFAPDAWEKLRNAFLKRDVSEALLWESGLVLKRSDGKGSYDRFRRRVMIPIADEQGRIVAFGGRIVGDGNPKYLNSPETAIFNKRKLLFGLDKAKKEIQKAGFALVVEGYMDVISVYAAGFKNVVASLGTAFTQEQCRSIMRYGAELYFCYDSDKAGQNATVRGLSIAKAIGVVVKVVSIPDGKDPDEFIRKHGVEEFRKIVSRAMPMMDFYIKYVADRVDASRMEGKVQAKVELAPLIASVRDSSEKTEYITRVSRIFSIAENEMREQVEGKGTVSNEAGKLIAPQNIASPTVIVRQRKDDVIEDSYRRGSRIVVQVIWKEPAMIDHLLSIVPLEFLQEWVQEVILAVSDVASMGENPTPELIMPRLSEGAAEELSRALVEELGEDLGTMYERCCVSMERAYLKQVRHGLRQQILVTKDKEQLNKILDKWKEVTGRMNELKDKNSNDKLYENRE